MSYEHLALDEWPFQVVPDERTATIWADRKQVLREMKVLLRGFRRTRASSIHLLWAYFGAGKTHFLRHMEHLAGQSDNTNCEVLYSVFPKSVKNFIDLYKMFARAVDIDELQTRYTIHLAGKDAAHGVDHELIAACHTLAVRPDSSQTIRSWLRAEKVPLTKLRDVGINQRIETSERAIEVMSSIIRLLSMSESTPTRVVWAIDEFQRSGQLRPSQRDDINIGLHSLFNDLPRDFSLLLSFSFGEPEHIKYLLSDELRDRANMERYFHLPLLETKEAIAFVGDILEANRGDYEPPTPFHPFEEEAVRNVIEEIGSMAALELKPRTIMQAFNAILIEGDFSIEEGERNTIDSGFALRVLKERSQEALAPDPEGV